MNNYTKGEWKTYKNALGQWAISTDTEPIAQVERHYNAQLIASAPDLYEACKLALHYIGTSQDKKARVIVEQALAKAEGK